MTFAIEGLGVANSSTLSEKVKMGVLYVVLFGERCVGPIFMTRISHTKTE